MNYGTAFARMGITGMGRQGAPWCALAGSGVMVLMAHQNYFKRSEGAWIYEMPDQGPLPPRGPSAVRSIAMLADYFAPGREIVLLIGEFETDGGPKSNGTWEASKFARATGDAYHASMLSFDAGTCHLVCEIRDKFSL